MGKRNRGRGLPIVVLIALFYWSSDGICTFLFSHRAAIARTPLASQQQLSRLQGLGRPAIPDQDEYDLNGVSRPVTSTAVPLLRVDMPWNFAAKFKNVHWIWQHAYQRFQCSKLASDTIADVDLPRAWELVNTLGAVHHAEVEDELFYPFVKRIGGEEAINKLHEQHEALDAKAEKIDEELRVNGRGVRVLIKEWAQMNAEHVDHEEELLVPLVVSNMREDLWKSVAPKIKKRSSSAPGGKMALSLFREMSQHPGVLSRQYKESFPAMLRWVLIPIFAFLDKDYADHKRIFGLIPAASVAA